MSSSTIKMASTEPRLVGRGVRLQIMRHTGWKYRFNGAAPCWARSELKMSVPKYLNDGLQRSRALLGAEWARLAVLPLLGVKLQRSRALLGAE